MPKNINLMDKIDQEESKAETLDQTVKKKKSRKLTYFFIFLIIISLSILSLNINKNKDNWIANIPIIRQLSHLTSSADNQLNGEERGRVNILLLGMGGKNHDGGYLTDTIMLASIDTKTNKVAMVSIPRDLSVPIEGMGWRKINNVNAFAENKNPGSGGVAISETVSDLLEIPIDYYVRVDFTGFEKIIDDLGGVDVNVDNTFDDYKYPIRGNEDAAYSERYEHLHFDAGMQHMDGSTALKYARSRHAAGVEGSDFARSKRQQKILEAAKEKLLSMHVLFKPTMIANIVGDIQENFSTNLKIWEMAKLWTMVKDVKSDQVITKVLDNSANGLLVNTTGADGAYLLTPRSGDFQEIQYLVQNIFSEVPNDEKDTVKKENPSLEILNGTWINGLASKVALDLEKYNFNVVSLGNSSQQNFQKSVIYDLTYGEKMESLTILKEKMNANVSLDMPQWIKDDLNNELANGNINAMPNFLLILGQDANKAE